MMENETKQSCPFLLSRLNHQLPFWPKSFPYFAPGEPILPNHGQSEQSVNGIINYSICQTIRKFEDYVILHVSHLVLFPFVLFHLIFLQFSPSANKSVIISGVVLQLVLRQMNNVSAYT